MSAIRSRTRNYRFLHGAAVARRLHCWRAMTPKRVPVSFARNAGLKVTIVAVEGFEGAIEAQYNPHTVQIDKTVAWKEDADHITYDKSQCRTVSMELMFDVAELQSGGERRSLAEILDTLGDMTLPTDPSSKAKEADRRPPVIKVGNGPLPGLMCVIDQLSIKITAYHELAHEPTRATVNLKLREVGWDEQRRNLGSAGGGARMAR